MTEIQKALFAMQDLSYREFHAKLVPTLPKERIIGVRTPSLRAFAKEVWSKDKGEGFRAELPHTYYEENNLHSFLLAKEKDLGTALQKTREFLPYVDNWATCDSLSPKAFQKEPDKLLPAIDEWLESSHTYTVRFGIKMLMDHFLEERFSPEYLERVARIRSEEYYINMMIAWYFATALAKQPTAAFPYIREARLSRWVHNKTIQKAVESNRISPERKEELKLLRRKSPAEEE